MNTNNCLGQDWRGESDRKRKYKNKQDLELTEEKRQSEVLCEQRKKFGDCDRLGEVQELGSRGGSMIQ